MAGEGEDRLVGFFLFLSALVSVRCLSRMDLFPYGAGVGDELLQQGDDATSQPQHLQTPFHFYDGKIYTIYVGTNGILATSKPPEDSEYVDTFPPSFGAIAPFLADLDTTDGVGKIYYRQDSSPNILLLAADYIKRGFSDSSFSPDNVFVATWENVAAYQELRTGDVPRNKRNTFQAVLAYDSSSSYTIFLYPEDGLQFYGTRSKKTYNIELELPARVGFSKGPNYSLFWKTEGPSYQVTSSSEQSVKDLYQNSNSGRRGVWVFKTGSSDSFDNVVPAIVSDIREGHTTTMNRPAISVFDEPGVDAEPSSDVDEQPVASQLLKLSPGNEGQQRLLYQVPVQGPQLELAPHLYQAPRRPLLPDEPYIDQDPTFTSRDVQPVQFQSQLFPQQNPQVVVVNEFDVTGSVFPYNTGIQQTCSNNRQQCSVHAICRDYSTGFCCHCQPGYYGNGKQCIVEDAAQRVNGKVSGRVIVGNNPVPVVFENVDMHSYVVVTDGRAYTAISKVPEVLGYSLLPLATVGGVVGWIFAMQQPGHKNGFSITGGEFTRVVEVVFSSNEKITIKQEFKGIDEHNHLTVNTEFDGQVPGVPLGAKIEMDPYTELYHYSTSIITSSSTRAYSIEVENVSSQKYSYQMRQSITFNTCIYEEPPQVVPATQQLSVDRMYVLYDAKEQLLRYAMSSVIGPVRDSPSETRQNPCYTGAHGCDTNAACRPGEGNRFTCECTTGFHGDGRTCYDVDECRENPSICGSNAVCNNQPGTFRCECVEGYRFAADGRTCTGKSCKSVKGEVLGALEAVP
uniref:Nidogen 1 n=1 Tax=Latimeria chalumnae TaxID=7897 RepID=H3ASA9_LATCH